MFLVHGVIRIWIYFFSIRLEIVPAPLTVFFLYWGVMTHLSCIRALYIHSLFWGSLFCYIDLFLFISTPICLCLYYPIFTVHLYMIRKVPPTSSKKILTLLEPSILCINIKISLLKFCESYTPWSSISHIHSDFLFYP